MSDQAEFMAFARRILRASGRRMAQADPDDLADLLTVQSEVDAAIAVAVVGLRGRGYSWAEIARPLGITRQAAFKRFGCKPEVDALSAHE